MAKPTIGFTGNQLKIFALVCMTLDHIGLLLLEQYRVLRYIGRLSMPVFAWMIAEGCRYTKNRPLHLLTIASAALVCQGVYWVAERSMTQCIMVTFSLSTILIYSLDFAMQRKGVAPWCLPALVFSAIVYACLFLPKRLPGFYIDYGVFGVLLPAAVYLGQTRGEKMFVAACCLAGIAVNSGPWQWFSFASLPLLYFYNGQRGKLRLKYLFYLYYPLHLAALYGISLLLTPPAK